MFEPLYIDIRLLFSITVAVSYDNCSSVSVVVSSVDEASVDESSVDESSVDAVLDWLVAPDTVLPVGATVVGASARQLADLVAWHTPLAVSKYGVGELHDPVKVVAKMVVVRELLWQ